MITTLEHAIKVQARRRESGKKGRSKAVRRWFKREYGRAVEAHSGALPAGLRDALAGDFTDCRPFDQARGR